MALSAHWRSSRNTAVGARRAKPELPGVDSRHVLSGDDLRELLLGGGGEAARKKLTLAQRAIVGVGGLVGASDNLALIREVTKRWMPLGRRVAILGGGLVGVELAEFLHERDREVTVIEESGDLAPEMAMPRRWRILYELREHGVELLCNTRVTAIGAKGIDVVDADGETSTVPADSVILKRDIEDGIFSHRRGGRPDQQRVVGEVCADFLPE